ncbi:MAG TPA: BatD family protein [Candidatus Cloacimonadota bacterium]|nr:BatD family protein [Candidatus Cloacimonadota bacterium]
MKKASLFLLFMICIAAWLNAQDVSISANVDRTTVGQSDEFSLMVTISGKDADRIQAPQLPKMEFVNLGVTTSSQSSISIVNGVMNSSVSKTYRYSLSPKRMGTTTIPPISMTYKGRTYQTVPIKIQVVKQSTAPRQQSRQQQQFPFSSFFDEPDEYNTPQQSYSDATFIVGTPSKTKVFKGEPVLVSYRLYTTQRLNALNLGDIKDYPGYGKEQVYTASKLNLEKAKYNGKTYESILLQTIVLTPNKTGIITIPTMSATAEAQRNGGGFWGFGIPERLNIQSKSANIRVLPLPEQGKPSNFTGAIGHYSINSSIDKTQIKAGESFVYTIVISGAGNISQFTIPPMPEIQNLRFMTPEVNNQVKNGVEGTKIIKYLVLAQEKGNYEIPPMSFSYFDNKTGQYITLQSPSHSIQVLEGDSYPMQTGILQTAVKQENRDIDFISNNRNFRNHVPISKHAWYWLLVILILLSLPVGYRWSSEQEKLSLNPEYSRSKLADKILSRYLKQATVYSSMANPLFYSAAQNGLIRFISDKLRIAKGSSTEELLTQLKEKGCPADLLHTLESFFTRCNEARFMPGGYTDQQIRDDYQVLRDIVTEISRSRRKRQGGWL